MLCGCRSTGTGCPEAVGSPHWSSPEAAWPWAWAPCSGWSWGWDTGTQRALPASAPTRQRRRLTRPALPAGGSARAEGGAERGVTGRSGPCRPAPPPAAAAAAGEVTSSCVEAPPPGCERPLPGPASPRGKATPSHGPRGELGSAAPDPRYLDGRRPLPGLSSRCSRVGAPPAIFPSCFPWERLRRGGASRPAAAEGSARCRGAAASGSRGFLPAAAPCPVSPPPAAVSVAAAEGRRAPRNSVWKVDVVPRRVACGALCACVPTGNAHLGAHVGDICTPIDFPSHDDIACRLLLPDVFLSVSPGHVSLLLGARMLPGYCRREQRSVCEPTAPSWPRCAVSQPVGFQCRGQAVTEVQLMFST